MVAGSLKPAVLEIDGERIASVLPYEHKEKLDGQVRDYGDCLVMPGVVDTHVHINEPGRTDWEGFETATLAAAAGGITTLIDMPLNSSPVTTTKEAFKLKQEAAKGKLHVDCGFWGGIVPDNIDRIGELAKAGVLGYKSFMINSGIDEFGHTSPSDLRRIFAVLADHGLPYLLHAETENGVEIPEGQIGRSYQAHVRSRPKIMENKAIALLVTLCEEFNVHTHIVHLSSDEGLDIISEAKLKGLPLTVETCPHYLFFASDDIPDGDPLYKCTPPIRDAANRRGLIKALKEGLIDTIGSDHSPAPASIKALDSGDIGSAWGGISSLQLTLPVMLKVAELHGIGIERLGQALCSNPATMAGIGGKKGRLEKGYDADLVVIDDKADYTPTIQDLHYKHKFSPYVGKTLKGDLKLAVLRGRIVSENSQPMKEHHGEMIIHASA